MLVLFRSIIADGESNAGIIIHTWVKMIGGLERYLQPNNVHDASDFPSWQTDFETFYNTHIQGNAFLNTTYRAILVCMEIDATSDQNNIEGFHNIPKFDNGLVNLSKFVRDWYTNFTFTVPHNGTGEDGAYILAVTLPALTYWQLASAYNTYLGTVLETAQATTVEEENTYKLRM